MLTTIYCDASFKDGNCGGAGYIRSDRGVLTWAGSFRATTPQEAEAYTMLAASQFAHRNWPETKVLYIVNDNKACVEYLWTFANIKIKNAHVRRHLDELVAFAKKNKIKIRSKWIKSHQQPDTVQTYLNNHVDKIAKNHRP